MCLLFFVTNNDCVANGYRLILVNNRDEVWTRPTAPASFGGKDESIVCGRDLEREPKTGTWLGMSKNGRIGVLLNILGQLDPNKKARGYLVTDYITSDLSTDEYLKTISPNATQYNGFNLVLVEIGNRTTQAKLFSNALAYHGTHTEILHDREVYGIGNTRIQTPWKKIIYGKEKFDDICKKYSDVNNKKELVQSLQEMMSDRTTHLPDDVLKEQCDEAGYVGSIALQRSQICVWTPQWQYGTRTTTVILIDYDGNCDFIEKTLVTPVSEDNPQYKTTHLNFKLNVII